MCQSRLDRRSIVRFDGHICKDRHMKVAALCLRGLVWQRWSHGMCLPLRFTLAVKLDGCHVSDILRQPTQEKRQEMLSYELTTERTCLPCDDAACASLVRHLLSHGDSTSSRLRPSTLAATGALRETIGLAPLTPGQPRDPRPSPSQRASMPSQHRVLATDDRPRSSLFGHP